jgi:hypothetical protein
LCGSSGERLAGQSTRQKRREIDEKVKHHFWALFLTGGIFHMVFLCTGAFARVCWTTLSGRQTKQAKDYHVIISL